MAHRLVWTSKFDDRVTVYERGEKVKGLWRCDNHQNKLVLRKGFDVRRYEVREWISDTECRATLVDADNMKQDHQNENC